MTPEEAKEHFGSQSAVARVLGVAASSVSEWFTAGRIPLGRQYQLELASSGALRAEKPANRCMPSPRKSKAKRTERRAVVPA